jgi:hypothetical protein
MSDGRIVMEANSNTGTVNTNPAPVRLLPANPPRLWQADDAPSARIVKVHDKDLLRDPEASSDISNPDITTSASGQLVVWVQTTNFPVVGTVRVRYAPKFGGAAAFTPNATFQSGDGNSALWSVTVAFQSNCYSILQAIATVP